MADAEDRTESATSRRLGKAREDGNVAVSRELGPLATLFVLSLVLVMAAPGITRQLTGHITLYLSELHRIDLSDGGGRVLRDVMATTARAALPLVAAALAAGIAASVLQTRFLFLPAKLMPDFSRLDPKRGLHRLFGVSSLIELGKSLLKVAVMAAACWHVLSGDLSLLAQSLSWDVAEIVPRLTALLLRVLLTVLVAQSVVAAADVLWVRFKHARDLRMSRSEVKQEARDSEGDPVIRRRLRQIRAARARRRMRDAVKRATVVVANPTHYAVALEYARAKNAAPVVVAKGVDSMAARIREAAAEFGVPVVVNPPLARALHQVEIDAVIPPELYKAVAELIAYVWRLSRRGRPQARSAVR